MVAPHINSYHKRYSYKSFVFRPDSYDFFNLRLIVYQRVPVIHTDEYAPIIIPPRSGIAKSRTDSTPRIANIITIKNVVNDVLILRVSVWVILELTTSFKASSLDLPFRFSRIRSKITIVALIE